MRDLQTAGSDAILFAPAEDLTEAQGRADVLWQVETMSRADLDRCPRWSYAFSGERKDHRYYEVVEDTIHQGFDYGYFALKDEAGEIRAIQPFFINDQDLVAGTGPAIMKAVWWVRRL